MNFLYRELINKMEHKRLLRRSKIIAFLFFILFLKVEAKSEAPIIFKFCKEMRIDANKIIASDNDNIFVTSNHKIYSIDPKIFVKTWEYEISGNLYSKPKIDGTRLFLETFTDNEGQQNFIDNNTEITQTILNTSTGIPVEVIRQKSNRDNPNSGFFSLSNLNFSENNVLIKYGKPVVTNPSSGSIILGYKNGIILNLNSKTGLPIWKTKAGGEITSSINLPNKVLISSKDNFIYLLESKTGNIIWKIRMSGRILNMFILEDNLIASEIADSGEISLVDIKSGSKVGKLLYESKERPIDIKSYSKSELLLLTDSNLLLYTASSCKS